MLKKSFALVAIMLALMLVLTACANNAAEKPAEEPAEKPAEQPADTLSTKTGVLIEASMHVVSIQAPDGSTYTFGVDDNTDIEGSEVLGNTMSVTYAGEYTSGIIAITIMTVTEVDAAASSLSSGSTDAPGAPQPTNPPATQDTIWYITGTDQDVSMNQLQLLYEDGITYTILKDDNTKTDQGIVVGCIARVFHKGTIKNGMHALEIHLIKDPAPSPDAIMYLTGTVTDATMNQMQLLYEDGKTYTILKDDNTKVDSGIAVGSIARVYHKGALADEMLALEIHLISAPP